MLKPPSPVQYELEMVTLEELMPKDHLLRLIDRYIRFDFTLDATAYLYCQNNGRSAIDPVVLFKMLFIGYLFGIRSERQLVKEIQVNVAYRWFLGLIFSMYINLPKHKIMYPNSLWLWGIPAIVLYWNSRVWMKVHRGEVDDDPIVFAIKDKQSLLIITIVLFSFLMAI